MTKQHPMRTRTCKRCGRMHLPEAGSGRLCQLCRERPEGWRMILGTRRVAPKLAEAVGIATYRPDGTATEVWERIRKEAGR